MKTASLTPYRFVKVESVQELRQRYIKNIGKWLGIACLGMAAFSAVIYIFSPWVSGLETIASLVIAALPCVAAWQLVKRGRPETAAWILFGFLFLGFSFLFSLAGFMLYYLMIYLICVISLIILGTRIALLTFLALLVQSFVYGIILDKGIQSPLGKQTLKLDVTTLITWWLFIGITFWLVSAVYSNLLKSSAQLNAQAKELNQALQELRARQSVTENESRHVLSMSTELSAISRQQFSGSQQQVSLLQQIVNFVQEMGRQAAHIIEQTGQMKQGSERIFEAAQGIKNIFRRLVQTGQEGEAAVNQTVQASQNVSQQYENIRITLTSLLQLQGHIRSVIDSIKSISDETHLLSLNASIEAASAGLYGERFMVVAGEVKGLANRAREASQEVNDILGQVETGINEAVSAVENGQQEVRSALSAATESGHIIKELTATILETVAQIDNIGALADTVTRQAQEINSSAVLQHNATRQTNSSLQDIQGIASQNLSSSGELSNSANQLESVSRNLLTSLAA